MQINDPRYRRLGELIDELNDQVRHLQHQSPRIFPEARFKGFIKHHIMSLYLSLPDNDYRNDFLLESFEGFITELDEEATLEKLLS